MAQTSFSDFSSEASLSDDDCVLASSSSSESKPNEPTVDNGDIWHLPTESKFLNVIEKDFFEISGPKHAPSPDSTPVTYFNLFFTTSLLTSMVKETNGYAEQFLQSRKSGMKPHSRVRAWKPVTIIELRAFIAVLLEMGITRKSTIYSYWCSNARGIPWFSKMFSRNRFQLLLKFFHLVDTQKLAPPGHRDYDPCARFNLLIEHANNIFRHYYVPHKEICIHESSVGTQYYSSIKQYPLDKDHHKWGLKFWMLCDSVSKYCLAFYCCKWAKSTIANQHRMGYAIVHQLLRMGNYFGKGYHLFVDNFYTSIKLLVDLLQQKTYVTGAIRSNRKDVPKEAKVCTEVGKPKYFSNNKVLMCSYRDKKSIKQPVIFVSTNANITNVSLTKIRSQDQTEKTKPSIIHQYNKFVGEIDECDKMLYVYLDEHRTLKYWKKVTFNIFGRMVLNAYILYFENSTEKILTRLQFTSKIIDSIEEEWLATKRTSTTPSNSKNLPLEKLSGTKLRRCVVCSNKAGAGIKRSKLICGQCKKGIHAICLSKHNCT